LKKKSSRKFKIFGSWILAFVIFTGVLVGVADGEEPFKIYELRVVGDSFKNTSTTSTTSSVSESGFNCDDTQLTTTEKEFCGNVVNQQIYCKVKQTTDVIDSENNVVGTEQSPFFCRKSDYNF
jgi:hypothetical protein